MRLVEPFCGLRLQQFHLTNMGIASKALQELPKNRRNFSGLTLGISYETYEKICRELETFQEKIMSIAERDEHSDNVYQLNFHLFPVTNIQKLKPVLTVTKKTAIE